MTYLTSYRRYCQMPQFTPERQASTLPERVILSVVMLRLSVNLVFVFTLSLACSGTAVTAGSGGENSVGGSVSSGGGSGGIGAGGQGGGVAGSHASGGTSTAGTIDLCAGLVQDKLPHPMTALAKPAVGSAVTDAEFGTQIRRITAASGSGAAIVPMYTTISAWNADESLLILYSINGVGHQLYNGKTYQLIRALDDINPADVEQVYWDTSQPDILYYVDNQTFIRYHISTKTQDKLHNFSNICGSSSVTNGTDPMFTSWDSHRLGLTCGTTMFIYDSSTDSVLGTAAVTGTPPAQVAPSGTLAYLEAGSGEVLDANLTLQRSLGLQVPDNHASLGQLANGHDTWNGAVYDDGNDDAKSNVGILVTWDLTNGTGGAVIGPKTGWPYPPDGHISAMAYKRPGWVFVSTIPSDSAGLQGQTLLGMENLIANTNTGTVCRVGRHRSWGKNNQLIGYWAEPHTVPSPSGTRAAFASDWGNGTTADTYILELPSYAP